MNDDARAAPEYVRPFVQLDQGELLRLGRDSDRLPKLVRLLLLAASGADRYGHARMKAGELGRVLGIEDKANVQRLIREAVACDLLDPLSSSLCLVLPEALHRRAVTTRLRSACCDRHGNKHTNAVGRSSHDLPTCA